MSTLYVVLERHFEYNDETYDASEGGNAIKAFNKIESAEKDVINRTVDFLLGDDISELYNYSSIFTSDASLVLEKIGISFEDLEDYDGFDRFSSVIGKLDRDDIVLLAESLNTPVFFIQEVELGDII